MVTPEQNAAFLKTARNVAETELGVDADDLTYEQRVAFTRKLAEVILRYPDRFTDQTLNTARHTLNENYEPLSDPSFDWDQFSSAMVDSAVDAGSSVAGVGQGVLNVAKAASWGIPLVVAAVAAIWLFGQYRKANA